MGLENHQSLHHFLTHSPWTASSLRQRRLELILQLLNGRTITLIVDDTGDVKKGKTTDYVKRQYIGNLGKIEKGIVAVTAYGLVGSIPFPLIAQVFKPKDCLQPGDEFQTKPQIAGQIVRELVRMGFQIELVLADRFLGESDDPFLRVLRQLKLPYVVAIRAHHGVLMPRAQRVRAQPVVRQLLQRRKPPHRTGSSNKSEHSRMAIVKSVIFVRTLGRGVLVPLSSVRLSLATADRLAIGKSLPIQKLYPGRQRVL